MKILHLSTYCNENNKEFPHIYFHHNMLEMGYDSRLVCVRGDYKDNAIYHLSDNSYIRKKINISRIARKFLFGIGKEYYYYPEWNLERITAQEILDTVDFTPNYIFVYWSKFSFNQKLLYELQVMTGAKIICVPLDMAFLTGGCHFSGECLNYQNECGNCPALWISHKKDLSYRTLKYKKKYIDKSDIVYLSGAELAEQMRLSSLLKNKTIYEFILGQDEDVFKPISNSKLKKEYNFNQNSKVIFFGATNLSDKRKGMIYLQQALCKLSELIKEEDVEWNIELLIAGNNPSNFKLPFPHKYVGFLKEKSELAKMYQMADVFVSPSIEDSGPLMVNQAILSGTPVASFDIGIAQVLVKNGKTGYKAKLKDVDELANNIFKILNSDNIALMKENCRDLGIKLISKKSTKNLISTILNEN